MAALQFDNLTIAGDVASLSSYNGCHCTSTMNGFHSAEDSRRRPSFTASQSELVMPSSSDTAAAAAAKEAASMKRDMNAIYSHPLFPLLALVLDKCELATSTVPYSPSSAQVHVCSSTSFDEDVRLFTGQMHSDSDVQFSSNPEVDSIILEAIQVLRFHLMEIEKVHQLCDSFCSRYISCLKGKMPIDLSLDDSEDKFQPTASANDEDDCDGDIPAKQRRTDVEPVLRNFTSTESYSAAEDDSLNKDCSERNIYILPRSHTADSRSVYSTDSQPASNNPYTDPNNSDTVEAGSSAGSADGDVDLLESSSATKRQKRRGIFPKLSTNIMRTWLFQHLAHPYPSEEQKKDLSEQTGLTMSQVNNWFINARRRIVQPMIDQTNRVGALTLNSDRQDPVTLQYVDRPHAIQPSHGCWTGLQDLTNSDPYSSSSYMLRT